MSSAQIVKHMRRVLGGHMPIELNTWLRGYRCGLNYNLPWKEVKS
jgi:hypothetical protein